MQSRITQFTATGVLGRLTYSLHLAGSTSIIVGPNGTGKSTFLSLLYLFISRQWGRLGEYEFESLRLAHDGGEIVFNRSDLLGYEPPTTRSTGSNRLISRVYETNSIDLIFKASLTREERNRLAAAVSVPPDDINNFRRYIQREIGLGKRNVEVDKLIQSLDIGQIIYLPTYRRIEKDIKSIFPDIEARIRTRMEETGTTMRSGAGFKEIASFGMGDIANIIEKATSDVREYQRLTSESASQEYIRDLVRGEIRTYSLSAIRRLDDKDFEDFQERLDDRLFSESDRKGLTSKLAELRRRRTGQPSSELRYLGMFVEKLLSAHQLVKEREKPLRTFVNVVSKYLQPEKRASLVGHKFSITDMDGNSEIPLEKLSSGEKQVISVFAYLLLSENDNFVVLIDEPELSLSVPWQKTFLPDILFTERCSQLIAVTHSPFVFDNSLRSCVVDVRRLRVQTDV